MKPSFFAKFLFILLSLATSLAFANESVQGEHVSVSLVVPEQFGNQPTQVGIKYVMEPGWHIYWKNPGDSGAAPKIKVTSSQAEIGPVQWPIPKRIPLGGLVNIGYEDSVILPYTITPKPDQKNIQIETSLEWLVCNDEDCLPGFAKLSAKRDVTNESWNPTVKSGLSNFISRVPQKGSSEWIISNLHFVDKELFVTIKGKSDLNALDIFPTDGLLISPQIPKKIVNADSVEFTFQLQPGQKATQQTINFIVSDGISGWEVSGTSGAGSLSGAPTLFYLLVLSFFGGLVLNFMPCVLPVLSLKFLSLANTPSKERLKESLLYTAGVLTTFCTLGGLFLVIRSAGTSIGWGFQLQSPLIVLSLIILFWLMAMNFLGVFEFGTSILNAAGKSRSTSAFATGILSVFIAAPCTGPFMGTALGAAAVLPALQSFIIFLFLGLGLASPFILVSLSPKFQKIIPRPGAWMEKLKQFFAFPLIVTVIWLLWVLHLQIGIDSLPYSLGLLLIINLSFWLHSNFRTAKVLSWVLAIVSLIYVGFEVHKKGEEPVVVSSQETKWQSYSPEKVSAAIEQGRPVFIDFTAAWCIVCQVNKKAVLRTERVEKLFEEKQVALFSADWTKQDSIITEALAKFGRNSVPLYVYYAKGNQEGQILPQILTASIIEDILNKKENEK